MTPPQTELHSGQERAGEDAPLPLAHWTAGVALERPEEGKRPHDLKKLAGHCVRSGRTSQPSLLTKLSWNGEVSRLTWQPQSEGMGREAG